MAEMENQGNKTTTAMVIADCRLVFPADFGLRISDLATS